MGGEGDLKKLTSNVDLIRQGGRGGSLKERSREGVLSFFDFCVNFCLSIILRLLCVLYIQ